MCEGEITMKSEEIFQLLDRLGLEMTGKTGGRHIPDFRIAKIVKSDFAHYEVTLPCGEEIVFLDGGVFLKTVQSTESSMNVRLFV